MRSRIGQLAGLLASIFLPVITSGICFGQKVLTSLPEGWSHTGESSDGPVIAGIHHENEEITVSVFERKQLPPQSGDYRHPFLSASRYAASWNIPLQEWKTAPMLKVRDACRISHSTQEKRCLIGVVNLASGYEAQIYARVRSSRSERNIREIVSSVLRNIALTDGSKPFRTSPNKVEVSAVESHVDMSCFKTADGIIPFSKLWFPLDLRGVPMPPAFTPNETVSHFDLVRLVKDPRADLGILSLRWALRRGTAKRYLKARAEYTQLSKSWKMTTPDNASDKLYFQEPVSNSKTKFEWVLLSGKVIVYADMYGVPAVTASEKARLLSEAKSVVIAIHE